MQTYFTFSQRTDYYYLGFMLQLYSHPKDELLYKKKGLEHVLTIHLQSCILFARRQNQRTLSFDIILIQDRQRLTMISVDQGSCLEIRKTFGAEQGSQNQSSCKILVCTSRYQNTYRITIACAVSISTRVRN